MKLTTTQTMKTATPLTTTIAAAIAAGTILLAFANMAHAGDLNVTNEDPIASRIRAEADARRAAAEIANAAQDREEAHQDKWLKREHEIWNNLMEACHKQNVRHDMANGMTRQQAEDANP